MNARNDLENAGVARAIFFAILSVASAIIVAALAFGPRSSSLTSPASVSARLQVPQSVAELSSLTALKGAPLYALDAVTTSDGQSFAPQATTPPPSIVIRHNQGTTVTGWAGDPVSLRPSDGVVLKIDKTLLLQTQYGLQRPDVAAALGNPELAGTGFTVSIPPGYLKHGPHYVDLVVLNTNGTKYYEVVRRFVLNQS